jgi:phosphatidylserine decarboxylase
VPADLHHRALIRALSLVPRSLLSHAAGRFAELRWPGALQRCQLRGFARVFGIDLSEVRDPLESFDSLQAFFTRALREGVRPLDPDPAALLSPCDGTWGASGPIRGGTLFQVKGHGYSLAELLASESDARRYEGGEFATLYLSPRDYHRFHSPADVSLERALYVPGTLWPVNRAGLELVPGLFARNERICAHARCASGPLCLVAVGATMVGKVRLAFDEALTTQVARREATEHRYAEAEPRLARGDEWGRFEFGSTLVLLLAPGTARFEPAEPGTPVRMGRRIGRLGAG